MNPISENQKQAAAELVGYTVMRLCPHQKKRHPKCLCGEIVEEDAVRIFSRILASRESAAAYAGGMSVVKMFDWPTLRDKIHSACKDYCGEDPCCMAKQASIVMSTCDAAKQAADNLKPKE